MKNYLTLGSTPCDENCAQVGSDNYYDQSQIELHIYGKYIHRLFPEILKSKTLSLKIKSFPHDFGTYRELVLYYDYSNEEELSLAYSIDEFIPHTWDSEALEELMQKTNINNINKGE